MPTQWQTPEPMAMQQHGGRNRYGERCELCGDREEAAKPVAGASARYEMTTATETVSADQRCLS